MTERDLYLDCDIQEELGLNKYFSREEWQNVYFRAQLILSSGCGNTDSQFSIEGTLQLISGLFILSQGTRILLNWNEMSTQQLLFKTTLQIHADCQSSPEHSPQLSTLVRKKTRFQSHTSNFTFVGRLDGESKPFMMNHHFTFVSCFSSSAQ